MNINQVNTSVPLEQIVLTHIYSYKLIETIERVTKKHEKEKVTPFQSGPSTRVFQVSCVGVEEVEDPKEGGGLAIK